MLLGICHRGGPTLHKRVPWNKGKLTGDAAIATTKRPRDDKLARLAVRDDSLSGRQLSGLVGDPL